MLHCDNISKTLNFLWIIFCRQASLRQAAAQTSFFGHETLFEHYGVYVDMNLCGAKFALKMGNFRSLQYNSGSHILIVINVKYDFRFFFINPQRF
jgi:hypothetical protein